MLNIGDVLDEKYLLESVLGRGGMGVVYRARHIGLDATRAIKVMHRELAENQDFLARFLNEAKLAEEIRHPNIVTLYDLSPLPDGTPYIVWEYVEGETLARTLACGAAFSPDEVVDLVGRVADGLAAAHERKIVHRDISPDNLMLTRDPQGLLSLKVLDFGMAKLVGSLTEPRSGSSALGVFLGKIGYSSPEQAGLIDDVEALDGRTDVFSLAVVAYRMLVGKLPFRTASIHAFLYDLTTAPEDVVRDRFERELPPHFRGLFARALRRNREERTSSMEELIEDLERARRKAVGVSRAGSKASTRTFRLRSAVLLALGVAVLLAFLLPTGRRRPGVSMSLSPPEPSPSSSTVETRASTRGEALLALPLKAAHVPAAQERPHPRPKRRVTPEAVPTEPAPKLLPSSFEEQPGPPASPASPETVPESVAPVAPAVAFGSLSITSNVWVEVRLDDGPPDETPVFLRRIPAGPHVLRVARQGSPSRDLEVIVREGETTAVHLENELPP